MSDHQPGIVEGDSEDPKAAPTWLISISGTLIFVAIVLVVTAATYDLYSDEYEIKYVDQPSIAVDALDAKQWDRLTSPPHIEIRPENPDNTPCIVIPIDEAMQLIVQEANE